MALPIIEVIEHKINVMDELLKIRCNILITSKIPMKYYLVEAAQLALSDL